VGSKLIEFECIASTHQASREHPDKLTIHQGRWAFCPFGALADGHDWRGTGGEDLAALMRKVGLALTASISDGDSVRGVATKA